MSGNILNRATTVNISGNYTAGVSFTDNFNGTTLDSTYWSQSDGAASNVVVSGGILQVRAPSTHGATRIAPTLNVPTLNPGMYYESRASIPTTTQTFYGVGSSNIYFGQEWSNSGQLFTFANGSKVFHGSGYFGSYRTWKIEYDLTSNARFYVDGTLLRTASNVPSSNGSVYPLYAYDSNTIAYYDYITVASTPQFGPIGSITSDTTGNLLVNSSANKVRITAPTDWRYVTSDVSATSLSLASSNTGVLYRVTSTGFNALSLPVDQASSNRGLWWQLYNTSGSNLSVTLTNTIGLSSPQTLSNGVTYTLYWNGTSNYLMDARGPTGPAGSNGATGPASTVTGPTGPAGQSADGVFDGGTPYSTYSSDPTIDFGGVV
jgi:hypothetical protein